MFLITSINVSFTYDPHKLCSFFFTTSCINKGFVVVVIQHALVERKFACSHARL